MNKKILLQSNPEGNTGVIMLDKSIVNSKNVITIQYNSADTENDFKRSFFINDKQEKTIKRLEMKNQDGTISFKAKDLKAMAENKTPLFIYTTAIPKDPAMAAAVRVRRFLLGKIEWK